MLPVSTILTSQRILSRAGLAVAVLFLFFLADNFITGHFTPKNVFRALPGSAQPISGELNISVADAAGLLYSADDRHLRVVFAEARGRLWRGRLEVDTEVQPGDYVLRVWVAGSEAPDSARLLRVLVFAERRSLRASYPSLSRRLTGIAPMWLALGMLPLLGGGLAGSFLLSSRLESYLAQNGIVPIVRMIRRKQEWEIHFALGSSQGISVGEELLLLNTRFEQAGRITIARAESDHSIATVPFGEAIAPSWWIVRKL